MYPDVSKIKEILVREHYISNAESISAEAEASTSADYIDYLIREQILSKTLLGQALAESYNLPFADFSKGTYDREAINSIPEKLGRSMRVLFVRASNTVVAIASDQPECVDQKQLASLFPNKTIRLAYTLPEYIEAAFMEYEQPLNTRFSAIIANSENAAAEILDEIIKEALSSRVSDIHFEPELTVVDIRFRVDGSLRRAGQIPKEFYGNIINRIKVESGMRIDEHFTPQDGSIQRQGAAACNLRVSIIPTIQGEKIVLHVLSYEQGYTLADIGLSDSHRVIIERYANRPFGMILAVGPTGSGKTTTLYSLVKFLNEHNINITTIEDPVEYRIAGVNQIQVREQTGVTFAKGLRSIVRQDPDIILVGEIRDQETADISVNAALTGRLLFSTFHSNNAAAAILRLIDLDIEPFLLASTLELIISQRLVRKICIRCKYSISVSTALAEANGTDAIKRLFNSDENLYVGKGCVECNNTGYSGRSALFEFIEITPEMQNLILHSPSTGEIAALSKSQGNKTIFDDGITKVKAGITTIAEVLRVLEAPKDTKSSNVKAKEAPVPLAYVAHHIKVEDENTAVRHVKNKVKAKIATRHARI